MYKTATESIRQAASLGQAQYEKYTQERLEECKISIHDVIQKNKLQLFRRTNTQTVGKQKQKVSALTQDCHLFSCLFIACQMISLNISFIIWKPEKGQQS